MKLSARSIYPGLVEGEALVSPAAISFFGGVDPDTGVVVERGHSLEGRSVAGKVLVFPTGKGSTVGSYTLYRLKANGAAPRAIVNAECETITAVGCIIAEIPCVDRVDLAALADGQSLRVDTAAGVVEILAPYGHRADGSAPADERLPAPRLGSHPEPLRGSVPGSFAEDTLTRRLPDIVKRVIAGNDWLPETRRRLLALIDEMPHGQLHPLDDPRAPDLAFWQEVMQPFYGQTWLTAPWMAAESYFFRRVLEASGFFQHGPGRGVDPYRDEKLKGLRAAADPLAKACAALEGWAKDAARPAVLGRLLRKAVWGNQADLSVFPQGVGGSSPGAADQSAADTGMNGHLLVDHSEAAAVFLSNLYGRGARVDIVFDNSGVELAYDLLLIDFLFEENLAASIVVHAKPFPTYVSDVTPADLHAALAFFSQADEAGVRTLAQRLQKRLVSNSESGPLLPPSGSESQGRLYLSSELHWAGPRPNWEMPAGLRQELSRSALLISKGDLNYRRWLGDRSWPFATPFEPIVAYRPAPLLALRVMKSNVLAGLPPGVEGEMDRRNPGWIYNGKWGMIQFAA